jgi:hypothetical protein
MAKFTASVEAIRQNDPVMEFVTILLHSVTNAHILHLTTNSYSQHKALGKYYTEIDGLVDSFAEAFQGKYGVLTDWTSDYVLPQAPIEYIKFLNAKVYSLRNNPDFPKDSELQNIVDEIATLIDHTLYKLTRFK